MESQTKHKTAYCHMIEQSSKEKQIQVRQAMVKYAQAHGVKPAARHFHCSKNTVKLWLRRFKEGGIGALVHQRKGPCRIPHKISQKEEKQIIKSRKHAPCYGPKRLKWAFDIRASEGAIARVLKQNKLTRKNRKKYLRKQDLRSRKAAYTAISHHQEDVKHLYDIPYYWSQMQRLKLPKYQLTIRDTKSGFMMLGYGHEYNELYSTIMTELYINHVRSFGIPSEEIIIQTDNGAEFGGGNNRNLNKRGFIETIEKKLGATHRFIPPGMSNANADVESVHATIEDEFFDLETFKDEQDFWIKAQTYQYFYNLVRPNFSKQGKTPLQIIMEDRPQINPLVMKFPVINLDAEFRARCRKSEPEVKEVRGQYLTKLPVILYSEGLAG